MRKSVITCLLLVLFCITSVLAQNRDTRIGDYYARAALRAVINTYQHSEGVRQLSQLLNEADVEASSPAEEASLREVSRILNIWINTPAHDSGACYLALKAKLKARNGATPEACK